MEIIMGINEIIKLVIILMDAIRLIEIEVY